jgi:hypothetical protein
MVAPRQAVDGELARLFALVLLKEDAPLIWFWIIIVIFLVVFVASLVGLSARFRKNEPPDAGGSLGGQFFGGKDDDDWGPTSDPPPRT